MPARRPQGTPAGQRLEMLRKADQDRDGKVTAEEFKAAFPKAPETRFKEMDRNGDGVLTHEDAPAGPATAKPPAGQGPRFDAKLLKEADADQDGKVTIEEARKLRPGLPDEAFKRMDADHDGALTEEDVKIQHKQAQEERRARMIPTGTRSSRWKRPRKRFRELPRTNSRSGTRTRTGLSARKTKRASASSGGRYTKKHIA